MVGTVRRHLAAMVWSGGGLPQCNPHLNPLTPYHRAVVRDKLIRVPSTRTPLCYEVCAALPPCCAALHAARARALRLLRARAWPALACTGLEVSVTCDTGLYARAKACANSQARNHQERRRRRGCRDVTVALSLRRLRQYFSTDVLGYSNNALCWRVRPAFSALLGAVPLS